MSKNTVVDMDSILDSNLDEFADLPEFVVPPAGTYNVSIVSLEHKTINDKIVLDVKVKINSTEELADPSKEPVHDGTEVNQAFFMHNEFGQGAFKKTFANIREAVGAQTTRELMESVAGLECVMVSKVQVDKKDKEKVYFRIVDLFPV